MEFLKKFIREEDGQDLVEYALLLVLLALAAIVAINTLGAGINGVFNNATEELKKAGSKAG